jgi:chorismate synthase
LNTIGTAFRITIFGSSHGPGVGCVVDGCPSGVVILPEGIQAEVDLRKPSAHIGTARAEEDRVLVQSGILDGVTTGAPIQLYVQNLDKDSSKYDKFRRTPRPGHADLPAMAKYGDAHDLRGGGQFSGRMTVPIVAAGAIAKALLEPKGVEIGAYAQIIGGASDPGEYQVSEIRRRSRDNPVRAMTAELESRMEREILDAKKEDDSVGGVVRCLVAGLPMGVGEPFFDTLDGELAKMMFAIPAVKGVEFGAGFRAAGMRGSEHNDPFQMVDGAIRAASNHAGGVLGGISTGMPLDFKVAFKPTASIARPQRTVDLGTREEVMVKIEGRHDPCIVPRAVVVVEAATALVLADLMIRGGYIAR